MRLFMTVCIALLLIVPVFASDYTITSGYYYGTKIYQNWDTLLMTGGGIESISATNFSILDIRNTSPFAVLSGGIGTLDLWGSSSLLFSGGEIYSLTLNANATALLTDGKIRKLYSYQPVTYPNYIPGPHIEMIIKDYSVVSNILTGHWVDNSTFNIQLMNQTGYDPVLNNIKFTIVPEPATVLLFGLGGLLIRHKK
jgi:hypothetical protein